ncbi:MAG: hypothetical protein A3B41_00535 [Candidatus Levybacteria bacterium RIFCSPLOWO2_01_FULL_37_26]|nr:MAG: hypothetical protein A3B41_00535 [Candidatus Levybacteria bacterium RIFCSPLOWO2_01_FULL_37_26]
MGVPLEHSPHRSFYRKSDVIFDEDKYQEKMRKENREMIERGKGIDMNDLTQVSSTINVQGRRTRGKGRRVNPKQP